MQAPIVARRVSILGGMFALSLMRGPFRHATIGVTLSVDNRKEIAMKPSLTAAVFATLIVTGAAFAQSGPVPEIKYRANADFLKLPADLYFGEVSGVAVNSKRHILFFRAAIRPAPRTALRRLNSWSSDRTENSFGRSDIIFMHGLLRMT